MNGVIYARYSSGPRQTHMSIEGQVRDCKAYASQKGITVIDTYIDEAISGKEFENRESLQRLIKDAKKKIFDCVIVWKIDRLGRCREELAFTKSKLKRCGVELHYAMEHIPEGPEGIILESLMEGLAEYYSAELSQKIKRGQRDTILNGRLLHAVPCFGYLIEDRHYVPDPDRKDFLVEIFERYAGGDAASKIADDFKRRGIRTVSGGYVERKNIYKILRNEKYTGLYVHGDIRIPDFQERLISDELFQEVQMKLAKNAKGQCRREKTEDVNYLLTGKLYCGKCKNRMTGESGRGKMGVTYHYYKCHARKNKGSKCDMDALRKEEIESMVIKITQRDVLTDEMIDFLCLRVMELQAEDSADPRMTGMQKSLKDVKKKITNIMNAIEEGIITPTTKDRLMELEAERDTISAELARMEIKKTSYSTEEVRFYLESFRNGDADNPEFARRLLEVFVNSIYVYDDYIVMFYNFTSGGDGIPHDFGEIADEAVNAQKNRGTCSVNVPRSERKETLKEPVTSVFVSLLVFAVIIERTKLCYT